MGERGLWAAVVLQARDDLEFGDRGSLVYRDAAAFFFNGTEWLASRQSVADHLGLHADDLTRLGQAVLAAREHYDGRRRKTAPTIVRARDRQAYIDRFMEQESSRAA